MFETYLRRWDLVPDGDPITTNSSLLLPVVQDGVKAMLKLSQDEDERTGGILMEWWGGDGAAKVLAYEDGALLIERARGSASLSAMSRSGRDDEACRILCTVATRLHAPRNKSLPDLIPLDCWFRALEPTARSHGGILIRCDEAAKVLLLTARDVVPLHGDLHHDNVLDFGDRGWLAIDPKRLIGERGFDYANIFANPDLSDPKPPVAIVPERFSRRLAIVTEAARLERQRLLLWILAWCGLSTAWSLEDGDDVSTTIQVAELALAELDR